MLWKALARNAGWPEIPPRTLSNHNVKKCITRVRQFVAIAPIKSVKTKSGHWEFQCKLKMSTLHQRYNVLVCETFLGLVFSRGRERAAIMQEFAQTNFCRPAPASQPASQSKLHQPASQISWNRPDFPKPAARPNWLADWHQNSERNGGS